MGAKGFEPLYQSLPRLEILLDYGLSSVPPTSLKKRFRNRLFLGSKVTRRSRRISRALVKREALLDASDVRWKLKKGGDLGKSFVGGRPIPIQPDAKQAGRRGGFGVRLREIPDVQRFLRPHVQSLHGTGEYFRIWFLNSFGTRRHDGFEIG